MEDLQQRISRIESDSNHLATKEDLAQLETRLVAALSNQTRWMVGLMIATIVAIAAVSTAIQSFFG